MSSVAPSTRQAGEAGSSGISAPAEKTISDEIPASSGEGGSDGSTPAGG